MALAAGTTAFTQTVALLPVGSAQIVVTGPMPDERRTASSIPATAAPIPDSDSARFYRIFTPYCHPERLQPRY